jgi:hypothetical protein
MSDEPTEFWFNTKTNQVEVGKQSVALYRIGPFATMAEAQAALKIVKERAAKWAANDEAED